MHRRQVALAALGVGVALILAACSSAASPSPTATHPEPSASAAPSGEPTPGPATYAPDAILLQFDATPDAVIDPYGDPLNDGIGGNLWFLPGPDFTMYGDGTVIFRDDEAARAAPGRDGRSFTPPALSIGQLSAAEVQEVLDHAWSDGGLAEAKDHYPTGAQDLFISASFTIAAGDRQKHVQVDGLFTDPGGPGVADRERLVALAEYLRHVDTSLDVEVQPWHPDQYWGSLREVDTSFVGNPAYGWPWTDIEPEGWLGGRRSLTPSDVAAIGLGDVPGGYCCHLMSGPDDDDPPYFAYGLTITPMWPERIHTDAVAEVVTTDLVVRTEPGTDASTSQVLQPTLAAPQLLYVVDGPVAADGYDWYLVEPFAPDYLPHQPVPHGWLPAGGRDGEPWIASTTLSCPPASLDASSRLSDVARLACYGNQALTLEGTFGGWFVSDPVQTSPAWLAHSGCSLYPDGYQEDITPGPAWLAMRLNEVPVDAQPGDRVRVEGHFDDPVARTCTTVPIAGEPVPIPELVVLWCRTQFVATAITAL
jgi:hypothetical protein